MQTVLHDTDELLVTQLVVVVLIKDLEDCVDQMASQLEASGYVDCTRKLI